MRLLALLALVLVAACGIKGPLKSPDGEATPPPASRTAQTSEQTVEPPPQAAPERVDDPVRRSKERGEDEFDLPPPAR